MLIVSTRTFFLQYSFSGDLLKPYDGLILLTIITGNIFCAGNFCND